MSKLFVCPTPIGNLNDITLRTLKVLRKVDYIACEDTRTSGILLKRFKIHTPMVSYHMHNEQERGRELVEKIKAGAFVAVISDAGMPGISDPGEVLIGLCIKEGISVEVLPGASAAVTAVVGSALAQGKYYYHGFLPSKEGARKKELESLKGYPMALVFYEAPHRIDKTLRTMYEVFENRQVVLCRELTKIYEEYIRGSLKDYVEGKLTFSHRGEFVIVVEGKKEEFVHVNIEEELTRRIQGGMKKSQAVKEVAKSFGLLKNEVYEKSLKL